MTRSRTGLVILGVVSLCLALAVGRGAFAAQTEEEGLWRSIADGLTQNIVIKRQELARMRQLLPEEKTALAERLSRISSRLDQLLLLRGVAGETPWASRTLLLLVNELSQAVGAARSPLDDMQDSLARIKQEYATLRQIRAQNASREYADLINEELAGPGRDFKELKHTVDALKAEVDAAIAQAEALSNDINAVRVEETERFIVLFTQTYFTSAGSLFRLTNLTGIVDDLQEWGDAGPRFWGPVFSVMPWGAFLGLTAVYAGLAFLGLRFVLRRRPESWQALRPGLAFLAVGVGLYAARFSVLYAANQFTSLFWVACVASGLFWLAAGSRVLPVLYVCFLAGVGMDALNLPSSAVCALWWLEWGPGGSPATATAA